MAYWACGCQHQLSTDRILRAGRAKWLAIRSPDRRLLHRVHPADLREPRKVRVRRADPYSVLDSKSRQVSIGDQIAAQVARHDEVTKDLRVPLARDRHPCRVGIEPVAHK